MVMLNNNRVKIRMNIILISKTIITYLFHVKYYVHLFSVKAYFDQDMNYKNCTTADK